MKILVADDDAVLRNELAGLLREDGHDVVGASDGGEALRLVERESFDAALLDLRMPKASGLQVLHRLRVARPATAVDVVTGQGTIAAAVEAMKAGAVDFVEKPYEVDALRRTLQTVQEEQRARTLLGVPAAEGAIARVLSDAATRKVLLAVVGPRAQPTTGATLVLRIDEEVHPASGRRLRGRIRTRRVLRNPEEELRRLVVQAFLSPSKTAVGRAPRQGRRRPLRGHGSGAAGVAGRPGPLGPQAALSPDLKIVIRARRSLRMACQVASTGRYI